MAPAGASSASSTVKARVGAAEADGAPATLADGVPPSVWRAGAAQPTIRMASAIEVVRPSMMSTPRDIPPVGRWSAELAAQHLEVPMGARQLTRCGQLHQR